MLSFFSNDGVSRIPVQITPGPNDFSLQVTRVMQLPKHKQGFYKLPSGLCLLLVVTVLAGCGGSGGGNQAPLS